MKKSSVLIVILVLIVIGLLLSGQSCLPEETEEPEPVDEADISAVSCYIDEMSVALMDRTLRADLEGWTREYYVEDDLPLNYDEERRQWLGEHLEELRGLREEHRGGNFPPEDEIAEWELFVVRGEHEWLLEGEQVLQALKLLEALFADVEGTISMIEASEGELDMEQSEQVLKLLEEMKPRVEEVKETFYAY